PQLHRPAATGSAVKVSHLHSNHCASRRTHDLRHSTATLLLEQGIELVVIKELLGHAHIGVTATVYAHVRLRLQRDAIDTLSTALGTPEIAKTVNSNDDEPPPCPALVR
ncbi:tyrosine-type recombinase/integrase, partial [Streptomyces sp. NPDC087850]|uniref:tyrosine-type recombinase/integrase n=1 Tax=Streptomyces sp. NPDC087850 TaxID=3365809 RepID=UPI00380314E4